ncbi:MAG: cytochrome P450 [bacterium]|nr:cytochrome P450 [Gammaproteobacteria bacterium]HIL97822.1 cytochrome P450 [Pseudomonadales bacterium]
MTEKQPDFLDQDIQECPYDAYTYLRDEQRIYHDPRTGMYHVSRYEDVRHVLRDAKTFSGRVISGGGELRTSEHQQKIIDLYKKKGWVPAATLIGRDDPNHKQMRTMFNEAFRPAKINALDDFVHDTADRLFEDFVGQGHCEWVKQFAVPLPLTVIVKQMGADLDDLWLIKSWTDAFFRRISNMLSQEDEIETIEKEIEAQHYFQAIFDRLRQSPDNTLLSELVNREIPEWGRTLNDNELHAEMMADTFVGGSETTTNALSAGVKLLIDNPSAWDRLKTDPDKYLKTFVEEVVRLESPVQCLLRRATREVELAGVTIPENGILAVRYGAANRDERQFECPEELNLDRDKPATHLAFGSGIHHCLGAPLARRELWWGFRVLIDRVSDLRYVEGKNDFTHHPHFLLRSLKALYIEFDLEK